MKWESIICEIKMTVTVSTTLIHEVGIDFLSVKLSKIWRLQYRPQQFMKWEAIIYLWNCRKNDGYSIDHTNSWSGNRLSIWNKNDGYSIDHTNSWSGNRSSICETVDKMTVTASTAPRCDSLRRLLEQGIGDGCVRSSRDGDVRHERSVTTW